MVVIPTSCVIGVIFALFLWKRVSEVRLAPGSVFSAENGRQYLLEEEQRGDAEVRGVAITIRGGLRVCAPLVCPWWPGAPSGLQLDSDLENQGVPGG